MNRMLRLLKVLVFVVGVITLAPFALTAASYFVTVVEVLLGPTLGALLISSGADNANFVHLLLSR